MLLAIDVGNTHTVVGRFDGANWSSVWRLPTQAELTEDFLAATYFSLCRESGLDPIPKAAICASVVPALNEPLRLFAERHLHTSMVFVAFDTISDLVVNYRPPSAVGADRIANAVSALRKYGAPCIIVDFGTATTFDVISAKGAYEGGTILPGVELSLGALSSRAAKLPTVELTAPVSVIGRDTVSSIQSGFIYGYAGAIDSLATRIRAELGADAKVIATGGLAAMFSKHCAMIDAVDTNLTLDGLRFIAETLP